MDEKESVRQLMECHHKAICDEIHELYISKNRDYGDSFHITFLEEGMAAPRIRMSDKLHRFKQLTSPGYSKLVANETIRDTLLDLAGYAILTIMELDDPDNFITAGSDESQLSIDDICNFVDPRSYIEEDNNESTKNTSF